MTLTSPATPESTRAWWNSPANLARGTVAVAGIGLAIAVSPAVARAMADSSHSDPAALWGLMPIVLYAFLALAGMSILLSTLTALVATVLLSVPSLTEAGDLITSSLTNQVTLIGFIIVLGAGTGSVLRDAGVAKLIVAGVLRLAQGRGARALAASIMLACLVLVAALGNLSGTLAIAAPLLIPVAARLGYTRTATATLMFVGGCAGLAIAPFAGSNVAIMTAADVGYGSYLLYGGGPLAVLSLVIGMFWIPVIQRRTAAAGDFYTAAESASIETPSSATDRRATAVFTTLLVILVIAAIITEIGLVFPLIALPILAIATGLAAKQRPGAWLRSLASGMRTMLGLFLLFWLLAVVFLLINRLAPYDTLLVLLGPRLESASPFVFAVIVALIGWVGVPGATAAQVVLLDQVFGPLIGQLGISSASWVVVLLFSSKGDTYGPFPNPNMVSAMGMARSTNLRSMLLTGWVLLVPVAAMYTLLLFMETR